MSRRDITSWVRPVVRQLKPYSSARDEYSAKRESKVFLDANENPYGSGLNRYPDPQQRRLKAGIARWRGIDTENILLGNGSDEILDLLFRVFCEPGKDRVITLPPTYGMYKVLAGINDVENVEIPLDGAFQPQVPEILRAAGTGTKMLFLCSPNNPTANCMDPERVGKLISDFPGIVVVDEAYIDFTKTESQVGRLADFPNLVVVQTFSKAMGLAGVRLGICMASPEIIAYLNRIKPPYNVNELTQQKALEALEELEEKKRQVAILLKERSVLEQALKDFPCVDRVLPSEANFLLVRVDNADLRYEQLLKEGIVVRNRSSLHNCENMLRFTIGTPDENRKLLDALTVICQAQES